ncbi:MAG: hypothetical protein ACLQIQ_22250 [Beijerinckiaceae bacterium]
MTTATIGHLYQVGDLVVLDSRAGYFLKADAPFTVIAQLPASGSDFQYRIKSVGEPWQRMVLEHQLTRASPRDAAARGFFKDRAAQTI